MKGIIVQNAYFDAPQLNYQVSRIEEELLNRGVEVTVIKSGYSIFVNENSKLVSNLNSVDFCIYLDKDKYFGLMLEKLNVRVFNPIKSIEICDDKMLTLLELVNSGIKVPKTYSAPLCFTSGATVTKSDLLEVSNVLGFPLVVKKSFSSLGKGVYLVNDIDEFVKAVNSAPFEPKIYQSFISSSFGRDVRIICVGKKYLGAIERSSLGDFRSNAALGGKAVQICPPKSFIETAEKVADILNLDYMGIDLLYGENGEPIVCEVNSNAFFTAFEQATGINVAGAYADYVIKTIGEQL